MSRNEFAAFVAPCAVVTLALLVAPVFYTVYLSFQHLSFGGSPEFVGWGNYRVLMGDDQVLRIPVIVNALSTRS